MTTIVGALGVKLGLDDSGFKKGLSDAERKSKSVGSRIASGLGGIGKAFGKAMLVGTAVGIGALAKFSKMAIGVASDLEEVQNVVDTVFGGSSKVIDDFAKNAGVQFGLSELAAKQYAGTMGALLTPSGLGEDAITSMSTELVALSGDMASFFNIADEEAFNKLRAGISGETEPLKQLGINMSVANLEAFALAQGIDQTFLSMTQAEQATLRYNFIMDATSQVQGDFAKTSESLANQQRIASLNVENLAKTFGTVLLPQARGAMQGLNLLITGLMPAFESLAGGLGDILAGTEGGQKKFQDAAKKIIDGIMQSIKKGLPKIIKIITSFIPVIVDTLTQIIPLIIETFAAEIPGVIEVLSSLIPGVIEVLSDLIPRLLEFGIDALLALANGIVAAIPVLIPAIVRVITQIIGILIENIPLVIQVAGELLMALAQGIITALPILLKALPGIIIGIVSTLITLLPMLLDVAMGLISMLVEGLSTSLPLIIQFLPMIIRTIIDGLITLLPQLVEAAIEITMALMTALVDNAPLLLGAIVEIGAVLIKGIFDLIPEIIKAGWNLIKGLAEGILSFDFGQVLRDVGNSILDGLASVFDSGSPSKRVKRWAAKAIPPGLGEGIAGGMPDVAKTLNDSVGDLFNALNIPQIPSLDAAGVGAGGATGGDSFIFNVDVFLERGTREEAAEAGQIFGNAAADSFLRTARARGAA